MKKEIKGIYLIERIVPLENETRKYYIGQALDIFTRLNQHCSVKNPGIDNAISELGVDSFSYRILEIVHRAKDLNQCETKWINHYKEKYGDTALYNIAQTTNDRKIIDVQIKKRIINLFNEDIGRSIYAVAECFNVAYDDVIKIRKPLLKKHGLKWNSTRKTIINELTGEEPENWRGYQLTEDLAKKVRAELEDPEKSERDISFVSKSDLAIFLNAGDNYLFAPVIKDV